MSGTSTVVSREHFDYIANRTHPEDPFLVELKHAAREADMSVAPGPSVAGAQGAPFCSHPSVTWIRMPTSARAPHLYQC